MQVRYGSGLVTFEISDTDPLALEILKREIRDEAASAHAQYPQYVGHWDGPEWRIARVTRRIKTKLGVAFEGCEFALVRERTPEEAELGITGYTAYSRSNGIDTSAPVNAIEILEVSA